MQMIPSVIGTFSKQELKATIQERVSSEPSPGIVGIVLGWPIQADGTPSPSMQDVKSFETWLKKIFPDIPIHYQDEFGSSQEAMDVMVTSGVSKRKRARKGAVDSTAAAIILQRYLEHRG
jgi:putative Holliday junction resolvase